MSDSLTQQTKVLRAIQDSGSFGVENWKLSKLALKYTSVISELRKDGYNIYAERQTLKNGRPSNTWRYFLNGQGEPVKRKRTKQGDEVLRELLIAKSKGRFGAYQYICERAKELSENQR